MFLIYHYWPFLSFLILLKACSSTAEKCTSDEQYAQSSDGTISQWQDVNRLLQHRVTTDTERERLPSEQTNETSEKFPGENQSTGLTGFQQSEDAVDRVAATNSILEGEEHTMQNVLAGEVAKESIEVVMARYDEDISWSDPYKHVRTTYCKSKKHEISSCEEVLPNVGREGHTYLYHIVKNYDNLAKWTVFTQAQDPTLGYRGHRLGGGHIMPGTTFDSYVFPESAGGIGSSKGAAFVFTGAMSMDNLNHSLRLRFKYAATAPALHFGGACPAPTLGDGWEPWWDLGTFKQFIGSRCNSPAEQVPKLFQDYWNDYIRLPWPKNHVVFFSQGARFAASRERILQRPKSDYEKLLLFVSTGQDPCWNYFNEWAWFYIIGAPNESACDTDLVIQQANANVTSLVQQEAGRRRRRRRRRRRH